MLTKMRKAKGFTLIELMIVVAIIGILAAIAIPNFMKFQCKSKRSEAKTNLAGIYTAETAYFAEKSIFSDYWAIGWQTASTNCRYVYKITGMLPGAGDACGAALAAATTIVSNPNGLGLPGTPTGCTAPNNTSTNGLTFSAVGGSDAAVIGATYNDLQWNGNDSKEIMECGNPC